MTVVSAKELVYSQADKILYELGESPETLVEPHLEQLAITSGLGNTELIITHVYISPTSSCTGCYLPSLDQLMMTTDTIISDDFKAHHSAWYSSSIDTRDTLLENMISGCNIGILNWDSPTRLPNNVNISSQYQYLLSLLPTGRRR